MNGPQLKARREALDISQRGFAAYLGVDVTTVSRWERGVHPIPRAVEFALDGLARARGHARRKRPPPPRPARGPARFAR